MIYLRDLGLLSYSRHRPPERVNWASPFLGRHSGSGCFIGPASLLGPSGWAPIFKSHQLLFWIHDSYCFIRARFYPETIYFFSIHFILNEFNPNHFLSFEIFVKILSLESLTTYHPENRKNFRLSHNSTKLFWVIRFRETNLLAQFVSSSDI